MQHWLSIVTAFCFGIVAMMAILTIACRIHDGTWPWQKTKEKPSMPTPKAIDNVKPETDGRTREELIERIARLQTTCTDWERAFQSKNAAVKKLMNEITQLRGQITKRAPLLIKLNDLADWASDYETVLLDPTEEELQRLPRLRDVLERERQRDGQQ